MRRLSSGPGKALCLPEPARGRIGRNLLGSGPARTELCRCLYPYLLPLMPDKAPSVLPSSRLLLSTQGREYSDEELRLLRQFRQVAGVVMANPRITVASATRIIGLSERTLYRKCKELTGLTPATYLRLLRLDRARELLLAGAAATVAEAAFAVGFEDTDYFARVFYRHYGVRASELVRAQPLKADPAFRSGEPEHSGAAP